MQLEESTWSALQALRQGQAFWQRAFWRQLFWQRAFWPLVFWQQLF